ncbi:hypothetical protein XTALMG727_3339 [Xanthomonas translucens pv. arrhenatheri LMG 727]|uniref:Uncharacterized protein n=1 Tax=Xanthomonas graminis pv. arrhenatheri LMG 727 TaxID=1195923 RepID=A0A0K2ZZF8_9XANT|nr:hypothetical protein XTALMG727_3339 [Xanthomonas translucens pv. arrhenatheri LMG 727]
MTGSMPESNASQASASAPPARPATPLQDPSLQPFLEQSATLRGGLAQLRHDRIDVIWGRAGGGTYLDPGRAIVIDENALGHGGRIARSLSHEMGHHRFTERPDMSSREAYVASMLRGEAAATLSNAQVRKEILAGGGADIGISGSGDRPRQYAVIADHYLAGRFGRDAALDQIGQVFKTEQPSVSTHSTYEQYYGGYYDRAIAPRMRPHGTPEPLDVAAPPQGHAAYPMYSALREQFPASVSDAHVLHASVLARAEGIRERDAQVFMKDDQAWVAASFPPGTRIQIDLGSAPPSMSDSLQRAAQQETLQQQNAASLAQAPGGPSR